MNSKSKHWFNKIDLKVHKGDGVIIVDDNIKEITPIMEKLFTNTISSRKKFTHINGIVIARSKIHEQ